MRHMCIEEEESLKYAYLEQGTYRYGKWLNEMIISMI